MKPICFSSLFALFLTFSAFSQPTVAYVTDTADSGINTLRGAIATGADTVIIDVAGELKLQSSINVMNDVVILGPSPVHFQIDLSSLLSTSSGMFIFNGNDVKLSGVEVKNSSVSVFSFETSPQIGNLEVEYCLFTDNKLTTGDGGVLNLDESSSEVKFNACSFWGNEVSQSAGEGGALFAQKGKLKVYNCTFYQNKAYQGGAIKLQSIAIEGEIINNTFYENEDFVTPIIIGAGSDVVFNNLPSNPHVLKNNIFFTSSSRPPFYSSLSSYNGSNNYTNYTGIITNPVGFSTSANLQLQNNPTIDGFGLKYFVFEDETSDCIDVDSNIPVEEFDARRSWRDMIGKTSQNFSPDIDAGAIEYTQFVVSASTGTNSFDDVINNYNAIAASSPSKFSIVFEMAALSNKVIPTVGNFISPDNSLIINGFSQEGSRVPGPKNSTGVLQNGIMGVELDTTSISTGNTLNISSFNPITVFIAGISFVNNSVGSALVCDIPGDGILSIEGNHIGVDLNGLSSKPNRNGVKLNTASIPEGTELSYVGVPIFMNEYNHNARNVISSNSTSQISVNVNSNIKNNFIGLNSIGALSLSSLSAKGIVSNQILPEDNIKVEIGGSTIHEANYIGGQDSAIFIKHLSDTKITKNYIGFLYGALGSFSNNFGVYLELGSDSKLEYNLIGNCTVGNAIELKNSTGSTIFNNKIGIALDSSAALVDGSGINILGSSSITENLGGNNTIKNNTIAHCAKEGIHYGLTKFYDEVAGVYINSAVVYFNDIIEDNNIGVDTTNVNVFSNTQGMEIGDSVTGVQIKNNIIAKNTNKGISLGNNSEIKGIHITENSIYENGGNIGLGIDLDNNNTLDTTSLAPPSIVISNDSIMAPIINAIYCNGSGTINMSVKVYIPDNSVDYELEFFKTDSDFQEGDSLVRSQSFSSLTNGWNTLSVSYNANSSHIGDFFTATLTKKGLNTDSNPLYSTSEFSAPFFIANFNPTISALPNSVCSDVEDTVFVSGGGNANYLWSNPSSNATINAEDSILRFTNISTSDVIIRVAIDSLGCTYTLSETITINESPSFDVNPSNIICSGLGDGSASVLNLIGGAAPYSFKWQETSLGVLPGETSAVVNGLAPGVYSAIVSDANGCSFQGELFTITEPTPLTLTINSTNPTCNGGLGTLVAFASGGTGTGNYQWNDLLNTTNSSLTDTAGTYIVTATDANGCIASATSTITEPPLIEGFNNVNLCEGDTLIVGTNSYTVSGNYIDTLSSMTSGCDSVVYSNLTIESLPNVSVSDVSICQNTDYDLTNSQGATSGNWLTMDENFLGSTDLVVTVNSDTSFIYEVNGLSCSNRDTLLITVTNSITSIDAQTACGSFTWIDGNTYNSSNNSAIWVLQSVNGCDSIVTLDLTINNSSSSDTLVEACGSFEWYGITYNSSTNLPTQIFTANNGCDSIVTLNLTIIDDCDGDGVSNGQELIDGTNPNDGCDYNMNSFTSGTQSPVWQAEDCDNDGEINSDELSNGTDPLDPCSNSNSSSILVTINNGLDTTVCPNSELDLLGIGVSPNGGDWLDLNQSIIVTSVQINQSTSYIYQVSQSQGTQICNYSDTLEVLIYPFPSFNVLTESGSTEICEGESIEIEFEENNLGTIFWSINDTSGFSQTNSIIFDPAEIGLYKFETTSSNCIFQDSVLITLSDDCESKNIVTTNAFSPNGNILENQKFILDLDIIGPNEDVAVTIYNRWGDIIFKVDNYDNEENVWDGRNRQGEMMPEGTYFYAIQSEKNQFVTSGWVYLDLKKQ